MSYAPFAMRGLVACPFCREMFEPGEAKACPVCGVDLLRVEKLPKKMVDDDEPVLPPPPDEETLPLFYAGRGRGALLAVSVLGLLGFMLPWVNQSLPEPAVLNGLDLARHLGWMWAPAISWLVMIALVASRRSIYRMRGARVAVAFLAAMSLLTVVVRMLHVPPSTLVTPVKISWGVGLYVTAAASVLALGLAAVFGGRLDDLPTKQKRAGDETLH